MDIHQHWENIYGHKQPHEVSWTQAVPQISLQFIHDARLDKSASIIDVGGGDSSLVDHLLAEGYENITVLDISETALARARKRLGDLGRKVNWVVSDILEFVSTTTFDFWHDRATFHFLTTEPQIQRYLTIARQAVKDQGYVTIGTFSEHGPHICSGLNTRQYSEASLQNELKVGFEKIRCITEDHVTPFATLQNFLFCHFQRVQEKVVPPLHAKSGG